MKKKILITGANGFIGFNLFLFFSKKKNYDVYGIGTNNNYKRKNNKKIFNYSLTKKNLLKLEIVPDIIIHCAGSGSISESYNNKKKDIYKNVNSTKQLLNYCKITRRVKKIIFLSSAAVYGNYKSQKKLIPISPYGRNKLKAEELCKRFYTKKKINMAILRLFSVYGAGLKKQLIWDACYKLTKKKFLFFGTGQETRSWINIDDVLRAIFYVLRCKKDYILTDIGPSKSTKVKDILYLICKNLKINPLQIKFDKEIKPGNPKHQKILNKNIFKLGWKQQVSLKKGIKDYVSWFQRH